MNTAAAQTPKQIVDAEAFAFVQALAAELSKGKVDLPSFPDIALRVRQVLADEQVSQDQVVRVVGSEPALAARLMQIANSAAINFSGKAITELRTAINRMGHNMVRSAAIAFAMSQLKKVDGLKGLEVPLDDLWKQSAAVAAMSHAVARRFSRVNPDSTYKIEGIPPGKWLIKTWQRRRRFKEATAPLNTEPGSSTSINLELHKR